jgi:O-acetylserine/cysteine efflux transporter
VSAPAARLRLADAAALFAVAAIWGGNFVVIKFGLSHFPPLFFSALRFVLVGSLALVLPRPAVPWRLIVSFGLVLGVATFTLMFFGFKAGIGAGVASVLMQTQVFLTILAAGLLFGEKIVGAQKLGLALGAAGLGVLAAARGEGFTWAGFALVMGAASAQTAANFLQRKAVGVSALALVVWMSLVAAPVLLALSAGLEGFDAWAQALRAADAPAFGALAYIALGATVIAYTIWGRALTRLPAAQVTPFALLIPVFGLFFAWLVYGEPLAGGRLVGAGMMIAGVALAALGPALTRRIGGAER